MRILFVHERFGSLGGAEANVITVARELAARGHALGLLHGSSTGKGEDAWREVFPDRIALPENGVATGAATARALESFQPEVIYVHKTADLAVVECLTRSRFPTARMVHDHDIYCMRSYKYNYFTRRICTRSATLYCVYGCLACLAKETGPDGKRRLRWVSYLAKKREIRLNRRFDRMLVASEYMRQELLRNGFDPRRIETHAPIPRAAASSLRSNFSDRNLILFAGQIIRGKGVDLLLRALAAMREPFECIILGDGNHRPECEALSQELGLADRVSFKGFVPQEELRNFYGNCSAVAFSSVWPEPFGAVGPEVMRYALPVVAFEAGGVSEWLVDGENGFMVPWADVEAFAARLDELMRDKEMARRMGENGFRFVTERFDFDRYISGLELLFSRLIAEKGGSASAGAGSVSTLTPTSAA